MHPPDTEYFWFELEYKESTYRSRDHDGYFDTLIDAREGSARIIKFHKKTIEDLGDVYEEAKLTIYRVSRCYSSLEDAEANHE